MMKRKNLYALFSCLFLSGCGMIDYHPYDVNRGQRPQYGKNRSKLPG